MSERVVLRHLLLVDDDELVLKVVRRNLQATGRTVRIAKSAAIARKEAQSRHFDLLIVDYYLRDQRGLDLIIELREENADVRAVIFSGTSTTEPMKRACEAGVPWFDKATNPRDLLSRIERGDADDAGMCTKILTAEDAKKRYFVEKVAEHGGNVSETARAINSTRTTIQRNIRPQWLVDGARELNRDDDNDDE